MVPKKIHYCWFGKNKKSDLINKCIKSWQMYCKDYEIIEWNEENFDINCTPYVREAYDQKKWAFVSDYCRMFVLKKYGGIYLDTDVELLKPLDDFLMQNIAAFEINQNSFLINPGVIFACESNDAICSEILDTFNEEHFVLNNGDFNQKTICERATMVFLKHQLVINNKNQKIENYNIYSTEFFNPYDVATGKLYKTKNTVSIHWFDASWYEKSKKNKEKLYRNINKIFGYDVVNCLKNKLRRKHIE